MASRNQFEVFGVDVRDYGQLWLVAWRDFLFGDDSPIRSALDSQVTLKHADGTLACYQAGRQLDIGVLLPLRLMRSLTNSFSAGAFTLPSIAEADLDAALHLEVAACLAV